MSENKTYTVRNFPLTEGFREYALNWGAAFPYCSYLSSNNIPYPENSFPEMLAVGSKLAWDLGDNPFEKLFRIHEQEKSWLFGYFTYELKNNIHNLSSKHTASIPFPSCTFFRPDYLLRFHESAVEILSYGKHPEMVYNLILKNNPPLSSKDSGAIKLYQHMPKEEYLRKVAAIQEHILEGDCYELNLCQEFSASGVKIDPLSLFLQLKNISPSPFASFQRFQNMYLLCASPERFMKKEGNRLISQPIKGTIRRGKTTAEDEQLKQQLRQDEKELAENMMIVDLVRNDLAKSCQVGSIRVEEMFGIYGFRHVYQMISTVTGELRKEVPFTDAIKNAFPMGSMTGAPKKKVMELIEQYENSARGLYSGSVGYISPDGNFDFNVVIRSLLYDQLNLNLSFQVGGAITFDSVPEKEYHECLLKAQAMLEVLGADIVSSA